MTESSETSCNEEKTYLIIGTVISVIGTSAGIAGLLFAARSWGCFVILFRLPENQTIVEAKGVVDEMFDFLIGKQVQIKDILRLGRFRSLASPSSRPRPLLIKLCTVWDCKLLLLRKSNLREFRIKRLFLREDVCSRSQLTPKEACST